MKERASVRQTSSRLFGSFVGNCGPENSPLDCTSKNKREKEKLFLNTETHNCDSPRHILNLVFARSAPANGRGNASVRVKQVEQSSSTPRSAVSQRLLRWNSQSSCPLFRRRCCQTFPRDREGKELRESAVEKRATPRSHRHALLQRLAGHSL